MNRQKLIIDIARAVHDEMYDCISQGWDRLSWEREYGLALVRVEVALVRLRNGMYIDDVDVAVMHDDNGHESPLLEKAIREALPDWFNVKDEVERQIA